MENSMLDYAVFSVGSLFALLAIYIAALNYSSIYTNYRNKKCGSKKYVSMIFLLPQILLLLAYIVFRHFPVHPVSGWLLLAAALLDPGIWIIAASPFVFWLKK